MQLVAGGWMNPIGNVNKIHEVNDASKSILPFLHLWKNSELNSINWLLTLTLAHAHNNTLEDKIVIDEAYRSA